MRRAVHCRYCGETGHNRTTCKKMPENSIYQSKVNINGGRTCKFCKTVGHNSQTCGLKQRVREAYKTETLKRRNEVVDAMVENGFDINAILFKKRNKNQSILYFVMDYKFDSERTLSEYNYEDSENGVIIRAEIFDRVKLSVKCKIICVGEWTAEDKMYLDEYAEFIFPFFKDNNNKTVCRYTKEEDKKCFEDGKPFVSSDDTWIVRLFEGTPTTRQAIEKVLLRNGQSLTHITNEELPENLQETVRKKSS